MIQRPATREAAIWRLLFRQRGKRKGRAGDRANLIIDSHFDDPAYWSLDAERANLIIDPHDERRSEPR
ncbi:MAG: hypothetical protein NW206_19710 [Hyphomonadaceae bacterium]|nr:hypothetical protein [Hyphomonadaceae bacterium]